MKLYDSEIEDHEIDLYRILRMSERQADDCIIRFAKTFGTKQQVEKTIHHIKYRHLWG